MLDVESVKLCFFKFKKVIANQASKRKKTSRAYMHLSTCVRYLDFIFAQNQYIFSDN